MKHAIFERLIEELAKEAIEGTRQDASNFAKWAAEMGIAARHESKISDDQEMFGASESLFAAGLYALLASRIEDSNK